MPKTSAEIVDTPDEPLPFKVVFSNNGDAIVQRAVTSELAAQELIASLLPLLQKHDDALG